MKACLENHPFHKIAALQQLDFRVQVLFGHILRNDLHVLGGTKYRVDAFALDHNFHVRFVTRGHEPCCHAHPQKNHQEGNHYQPGVAEAHGDNVSQSRRLLGSGQARCTVGNEIKFLHVLFLTE